MLVDRNYIVRSYKYDLEDLKKHVMRFVARRNTYFFRTFLRRLNQVHTTLVLPPISLQKALIATTLDLVIKNSVFVGLVAWTRVGFGC